MSASTASADSHAATAPDASAPATAAPMDLKIPITGVVVLLLQGFMALGARGSTTFDLTASSDLFRLGAPELNARLVILTTAGIVAAATAVAFDRSRRRSRIPTQGLEQAEATTAPRKAPPRSWPSMAMLMVPERSPMIPASEP